jgi:hypothetical protein
MANSKNSYAKKRNSHVYIATCPNKKSRVLRDAVPKRGVGCPHKSLFLWGGVEMKTGKLAKKKTKCDSIE